MINSVIRESIQGMLDKADIRLNGSRPQDISLYDDKALKRIFNEGSIGLGETYMAGMWDCDHLDEFSYRICKSNLHKEVKVNFFQSLYNLSTKIINYQTKNRSKIVAQKHYNLDNNLFELMLDPSMTYSCAYWKDAQDLNEAQRAKNELICKKLHLTSEDTLLDIGCGWGGFAAYAAEHFGCHVTGISIASEQISYAKKRYKHLPIEFHTTDYRDIRNYNPRQKKFSKLVSIGAFEHIGSKNYFNFFKLMHAQLHEEGLFLLHTIGTNETTTTTDPWINKYIFPNGNLPSILQLAKVLENRFIVEDWQNFGSYYDKTLLAWHHNFEIHWEKLRARFDYQFYRMWRYYLLMCAGMFRARRTQLWQIVLSKNGLIGGYEGLR